MKIEFTKEELVTLLNGLYAGADGAFTMGEQEEYDVLAERIEEVLRD
jgi:hypothetical protein